MRNHPVRSTIMATLLFLVTFAGDCFFTPREPEKGDTVEAVCDPVQTAEDIPDRMSAAMESFSTPGFQCLLSAANFVFRPDASDSTDLADLGLDVFTTTWNRDREVGAFELLITCFNNGSTRIGGISLAYVGDEIRVTDSTTTVKIIETDYEITILSVLMVNGESYSLPLGGALRWVVQDEGDSWRIIRWDDFRKGETPTWGNYTGGADGGSDFCPDDAARLHVDAGRAGKRGEGEGNVLPGG